MIEYKIKSGDHEGKTYEQLALLDIAKLVYMRDLFKKNIDTKDANGLWPRVKRIDELTDLLNVEMNSHTCHDSECSKEATRLSLPYTWSYRNHSKDYGYIGYALNCGSHEPYTEGGVDVFPLDLTPKSRWEDIDFEYGRGNFTESLPHRSKHDINQIKNIFLNIVGFYDSDNRPSITKKNAYDFFDMLREK
jgi:hypothetical protein